MTVIDLSTATLQAMLDGGDDDDWVPIVKARAVQHAETTVIIVRVQTLAGDVVDESRLVPGDELRMSLKVKP